MIARYTLALLVLVVFTLPAAAAAPVLRGDKPLKGRYIVMLADHVRREEVDAVARMLTRGHGGRLLATMKYAMRGFGVVLPEHAVEGLRHNPFVRQIEEDQLIGTPSAPGVKEVVGAGRDFSFRKARVEPRTPVAQSATSCLWDSAYGYYRCAYTDRTLWNLDRIDNLGLLSSTKAYGYTSMGTDVRAYVVDYGVHRDHYEFDGRVEVGANMMVDPEIADAKDPNHPLEEEPVALDYALPNNPCGGWLGSANMQPGHGTAVASVLGGGTTGVAKNVTIVPVKVWNCQNELSMLAATRGLDWIAQDMINRNPQFAITTRGVVNMSLAFGVSYYSTRECEDGAGGYTNCLPAFEHEINTLLSMEIPVVASANNQDANLCASHTPARMGYSSPTDTTRKVITVGATAYNTSTLADERWSCITYPAQCPWNTSNQTVGSNYGPCVSIWAPGANLRVADATGASDYRPTNTFYTSGTSFAAPTVAGAIARLFQTYPNMTVPQVWAALVSRANQRTGTPDFDPSSHTNTRLLYISPTE